MFDKFKKIFKLSNWKRWTISSISLVSMALAITLGSIYSVSNNKPTTDYKSGAEIVIKMTDMDDTPEVIKRQVEQRLNLSLPSDSSYEVTLNSNDFLTIKGTNIETDEQMKNFTSFIQNKEKTTVTTIGLGTNGMPNVLPFQFSNATMSNGTITLTLASPVFEKSEILIWRNLDELITLATTEYNDEWTSVGRDPYKFMFINGITEAVENGQKPILKTKAYGGFNALDYLISKNPSPDGGKFADSIALDFTFAPNITSEQKEKIFYNLDFSVSPYNLDLQTYNFIKPALGNNAYQFLIIAGAVAFSFVSIFLVVNYGLLGALSTICAAFLVFLGLLMITVFRGEYSAESIAALMVAVGIGLDLNIIFFERFKKELKSGNSLQKSLKKADKLTLSSSITKAVSLIITSVIIYIIGSLYLGTFSSLILIMSIFISVVMFVLIRLLTTLILETKVFDNKKHLFGIYRKTKNLPDENSTKQANSNVLEVVESENEEFEPLRDSQEESTNNSKHAKAIGISKKVSVAILGVLAAAGVALYTTFSVLGSGWLGGFKADGAITHPTVLKSVNQLSALEAQNFKTIVTTELGVTSDEISMQLVDKANDKYLLEVSTTKKIDAQKVLDLRNQGLELINYSVIAKAANDAILYVFYIALATILAMSIFVLMRSDWTYALSMFISLTIGIILFVALFALQVFSFNTFFALGLSAAILMAVSNNITILFRIKEKLKNRKIEELTKTDLKEVSNIAVKSSISRLLISNGIMMGILIIFTVLPGASYIFFTIPLAIFILISLVISTVILPFFFNIFKAFKCKRKRERIINNYWETQRIQEQIFPGINDIK